ncbi:MAG: hypothetical protein ACR2Q3_15380 [Woeseiaceae bacterium]
MRIVLLVIGSALLLVGLISMVTPIPGSTFLIATGTGLLICTSKRVTSWIRQTRTGSTRFNRSVTWIENKMGDKLSGPLRQTRPIDQTDTKT